MTVQEMDICLNISAEPTTGVPVNKKSRARDSFKGSIKRLKLKKGSIGKKNSQKDDRVKSNLSSQNEGQKRVKQKALAAIVAKKLQQNNASINSQSTQKVPMSQTQSDNKSNVSATLTTNKLENATSKPNVLNANTDNVVSNTEKNTSKTSDISFVKVQKQSTSKAVFVKKRNISQVGPKKSLSDIFSNQAIPKDKEPAMSDITLNTQTNESNALQEKSRIEKSTKPVFLVKQPKKLNVNTSEKKKKQLKGIAERKANKNESFNKMHKTFTKQTGKSSSLFRNNPEVPNIGQRLVKPISETVFAKTNFSDLNIHPYMVSNLEQNMNITKMTTVQQKAIPQIFSGKDVLIRSQTGSGKTLTYAIPIVECLHKIRPKLTRSSGLSALVVVPTRELALQTYECFLKLRKPFTWIVAGYLVGGEKRKAEKARLRKGCNILVGTPGRLLDHIRHTAALKLNDVKYFVLDEADRMLDAGYEKDISGIVDALKGVSLKSDNSGYDAMEMLRQNTRKVFTEEETEDKKSNDDQISKPEMDTNSDNDDKEEATRQAYHSNSESESEEDDFPTRLEKIKEKKTVAKAVVAKEEDTKLPEENIAECPTERQTILLSATLTQAVEKLAGLAMNNPIFVDAAKDNLVTVGGDMDRINEDFVVPQSVVQSYIITPPKLRIVTLSAYIVGRCKRSGKSKIVVFMATQDMVDYYTDILSSVLNKPTNEEDEDSEALVNVEFLKLHGNMDQKERTEVFKTFRLAKSSVLLCTDVAARGLDLPKVDCVVQYTGPLSARDYVHRIGRTARAGSSGSAVIFLTPPEIEFVRMLESRRIRIKQEDMDRVLANLMGPLCKHNSVQEAAIALQRDFEALVFEDKKLHAKACRAYTSWVRFYTSYPHDMREIFNRKELHLGHYAKSFALSDRPQRIGAIGMKFKEQEDSKGKHDNRLAVDRSDRKKHRKQDGGNRKTGYLKKVRMLNVSEYGSGLAPIKKPRKS
ncbi:hypothetical protein KPH14_004150 [Odynerus spinipes]|uniref:ATP-dependent RNA helicase n=1 Tax=Odynerus spinipes TaxID=1348599 RepID=A0AAD9RYT2_9HYME|nr:hypothetical protein KPH14_004150 [Odynerus spinipes]